MGHAALPNNSSNNNVFRIHADTNHYHHQQTRPARARQCQAHANVGQSDIWLSRNGRRVNAKSIMGVMMLAAGLGAEVVLEAEGPDESEAISAVSTLFADKFGEGG
jgi:phosphocarrier protein HPr